MTPETQRADNLRGILMMILAVGSFAMMDAALKLLTPHYPATQVAALRGYASLPVIMVWAAVLGTRARLFDIRWGLHLLRGALGILMLACFAFALRTLPLSEAYAIFFFAPLLITALAAPILGEKVDYLLPWVKLNPDGDYNLKSDSWIEMKFSLEVLKATGKGGFYANGLPVYS